MENHKINKKLSVSLNVLMTKLIYPIKEYNKNDLTDNSYIFTPNHTNNLDGYIIWCLLSRYYDIDIFMYKEFWENYPRISKLLPILNVYPITRDKLVLSEIKDELKKLRDDNHSLVIFPQGRHVAPEIMLRLKDYHLETIPGGAFYFSAESNKSFIPIYMEPQKPLRKSVVVYGKPINPNDYDIKKENGKIDLKKLYYLKRAWIDEINRCYLLASELENRKMNPYVVKEHYMDASGSNHKISDPNRIANYIDEIEKIIDLREQSGVEDIEELCHMLSFNDKDTRVIVECTNIYKKHLLRK